MIKTTRFYYQITTKARVRRLVCCRIPSIRSLTSHLRMCLQHMANKQNKHNVQVEVYDYKL